MDRARIILLSNEGFTVEKIAEKLTVRFRDDQGWPVWPGGFGRGRGR